MYVLDRPPSPPVGAGSPCCTFKACEQAPMLVMLNNLVNRWKGWQTACCANIPLEIPPKSVQILGIHVPILKLTKEISGKKELLTWTSSDVYSKLLLEGITQSTRRCKSALCRRAALLPMLHAPAQLPQSIWMWPSMEASIVKPGVGNAGHRGSREQDPMM